MFVNKYLRYMLRSGIHIDFDNFVQQLIINMYCQTHKKLPLIILKTCIETVSRR